METRQAKRAKAASYKQKAQNLPLLCIESILKFTPTSKLVRLYSSSVPLPGAFWNLGVEAMLKKRLPLSLGDDLPYHQADWSGACALFDSAGTKIATVKRPAAIRFSKLSEFVKSVSLTFSLLLDINWQLNLYVLGQAQSLLDYLPNVTALTLNYSNNRSPTRKSFTEVKVKHLLPHLQSFTVSVSREGSLHLLSESYALVLHEFPIHEMTSLVRLSLPLRAYRLVVETATEQSSVRRATRRVLSGLRSLNSGQWWTACKRFCGCPPEFLSINCQELSSLSVVVREPSRAYLRAFHIMRSLTSLELCLLNNLNGLNFGECDAVTSVLDLRVVYLTGVERSQVFAVTSLFRNAKSVAFKSDHCNTDALDLAFEFCAKQVLPKVDRLSCFVKEGISPYSSDNFLQFLANPRLPETVDLSRITFEKLAGDSDSLTAIYRAMQANSTKNLLLRGPIHREALARLQGHINLNGDSVDLRAWKDRDLSDQSGIPNFPEISPQTDIKIIGRKVSGRFEGEEFTMRIFHQDAKRSDIFD